MKKIFSFLLLFVLFNGYSYSQQFKFAWLTDTHIGAPNALEYLSNSVKDINSKDFNFVIHSGDITETGFTKDLTDVKNTLDSLKIKYHIIPGNHDVKWSESAGHTFTALWGEDKFNFTYGGIRFIGFCTGILMRNHGGHASPENLLWLENTLKSIDKNEPVIIVTHHMLDDELDNWFEVTNRLKNNNVIALLCGHGHTNKNSSIAGILALMARSNLKSGGIQGYCSVTVTNDSLLFFEQDPGMPEKKLYSIPKNKKYVAENVDSAQFINYNVKVLNNVKLNKTLTYGLYTDNDYLSTASLDGIVFLLDKSGKELWRLNVGEAIVARPAIINKIVVAGTVNGSLVAIDCATGKLINKIKLNQIITSQFITCELNTAEGRIPVVYFGTTTGSFYCYEVKTLKEIWANNDAKNLIECEPVIVNNKIIFGSWDCYVYCCDAATGKNIWRWQGDKRFHYAAAACKPATDGENIYVAAPDRYISSISISTGKTNWRTNEPKGWESIGYSNERKCVVVKGFDKFVYFVNPSDGSINKRVPIDNDIETMATEVIDVKENTLLTTRKDIVYLVDKEYNLKPLMFLGTSKGHAVKYLGDDTFAVSNLDGRIVIFKLNN